MIVSFWNCFFFQVLCWFQGGYQLSKTEATKMPPKIPQKVLKAALDPEPFFTLAQAAKDTQDCRQWRRRAESLEVECSKGTWGKCTKGALIWVNGIPGNWDMKLNTPRFLFLFACSNVFQKLKKNSLPTDLAAHSPRLLVLVGFGAVFCR